MINRLSELTENIRRCNLLGLSVLPILELAFIQQMQHLPLIEEILSQLHCHPIALIEGIQTSGYCLYRTDTTLLEAKVYVIADIESNELTRDQEFIMCKKQLQRLRRNRNVIFVTFAGTTVSDNREHFQLLCLQDYAFRQVKWNRHNIYDLIARKYEAIHRGLLIAQLQTMKNRLCEDKRQSKRLVGWMAIEEEADAAGKEDDRNSSGTSKCLENNSNSSKRRAMCLAGHALRLGSKAKDSLVASLTGSYCPWQCGQQSLHWQVMELLDEVWEQEGEQLLREVDQMSLSYIQQQFRLSSCHSISGFLPQACFRRVFAPPLRRLVDAILQLLGVVTRRVERRVEEIFLFYFQKTSLADELIQKQLMRTRSICQSFLEQVSHNLESQVNFIYAPPEQFAGLRQVQSKLYSEEQQANIEIKFIGKAYVRKVYSTVRESVPRYVGYNLLRRLADHFGSNCLNELIDILKETPFDVVITHDERKRYAAICARLDQLHHLIGYFSMKISSAHLIKNLYEKQALRWKQTFGTRYVEATVKGEEEHKRGFFERLKLLFVKSNKKRAVSQGKLQKSEGKRSLPSAQEDEKENIQSNSKQGADKLIADKNWFLILNTGKKVNQDRLIDSSCYGFPEHLRAAIWSYLAERQRENSSSGLEELLVSRTVDPDTLRQVKKDVLRTPPTKLFLNGMLQTSLTRVLIGYSLWDVQIGYTQGMNFICGVVLSVLYRYGEADNCLVENGQTNLMDLEERTFAILRYLMKQQGLRKLMLIERDYITDLCLRLDRLILKLNQKVWKLIQDSGFTCEMIFASPLISALNTSEISFGLQKRVMDLIMVQGFNIVHKIIAHFVAQTQHRLSRMRPEQIYDYLRHKVYNDVAGQIGDQRLTILFQSL